MPLKQKKLVIMNKVIYINNECNEFNVKENEMLEIYHFVIDKSVNTKINLEGENSKVVYHLSIISNKDNTCKIDVNHVKSNTESKIICHGVNMQNESLEFNVTGLVPKNVSKCICNEDNEIINLKNGKSVIKPNLLIRNYDTFSNHSAYIGEFNKEKMFYLESRGISKEAATRLLMKGLLLGDACKEEKIVKEFTKYLMEVYNG